MALLDILEFPDPRLRTKARPVVPEQIDDAFRALVDDMLETMYAAPGIGLAATQVDVHQRFMVIDVSEEKNQPLLFINPEILDRQGSQVYQEGCLSVPGIFADVERAEQITVRALDRSIEETYAARSTAQNKNSLYDSYVRAIRWASDRISNKGIVCFVTNGGFIDGNAAEHYRHHTADVRRWLSL